MCNTLSVNDEQLGPALSALHGADPHTRCKVRSDDMGCDQARVMCDDQQLAGPGPANNHDNMQPHAANLESSGTLTATLAIAFTLDVLCAHTSRGLSALYMKNLPAIAPCCTGGKLAGRLTDAHA